MKLNEHIKIVGQKVILIPYEAKHVEKYHKWMQDPLILELTASEPLDLVDEQEMQKEWREDKDKLTFLVVDKQKYEETGDEIESLVGDTNLYVFDDWAEAEIMIAEVDSQGKRFGWEAMLLMLNYGCENLPISMYVAKIVMTNHRSINMFEKMLFTETSRSEVFKEVTLERVIDDEYRNWLKSQLDFEIAEYTV